MKFLTLFAAVSAASVIIPRAEVDTMKSAIKNIKLAVDEFRQDIQNYKGGESQELRDDAKNIILAINAADADAKAMPGPLNDIDSASLALPIQSLGNSVGLAVEALIRKKSTFGCHGAEVYQSLTNQKTQSIAFQADLTEKVGPAVKFLADQLSKPIFENIERGLSTYADQANVTCDTPPTIPTTSTTATSIEPTVIPSPTTTSVAAVTPPVSKAPATSTTAAAVANPAPVASPASAGTPAAVKPAAGTPSAGSKPVADEPASKDPVPVVEPVAVKPQAASAPTSVPVAVAVAVPSSTPAANTPVAAAPAAASHTSASASYIPHPSANSTSTYSNPAPTVVTGGASASAAGFGVAAIAAFAAFIL